MRQSDITVSLKVKPLLEIVDLQLRPLDLHTAPSTGADTPLSLQAVLSLAVQNLGPAVVSVRLQSRQGSNENWDNDGPHRLPSNGVRRYVEPATLGWGRVGVGVGVGRRVGWGGVGWGWAAANHWVSNRRLCALAGWGLWGAG